MDCDPDSTYHIRNSGFFTGLFAMPFTLLQVNVCE